MHELTVKLPKEEVTIKINEPNFDQLRGALLACETPSGKVDRLAAGNFLMEVCVVPEDREGLDKIKKDPKAQASAALEAYGLMVVYEAELKKK